MEGGCHRDMCRCLVVVVTSPLHSFRGGGPVRVNECNRLLTSAIPNGLYSFGLLIYRANDGNHHEFDD
jgi:hypothetical protein